MVVLLGSLLLAIVANYSLTFSTVSEREYEKVELDMFLLEFKNNFSVINGTLFTNCRGEETILVKGKANFAAMMEMLLLTKADGMLWETAELRHSSVPTSACSIEWCLLFIKQMSTKIC